MNIKALMLMSTCLVANVYANGNAIPSQHASEDMKLQALKTDTELSQQEEITAKTMLNNASINSIIIRLEPTEEQKYLLEHAMNSYTGKVTKASKLAAQMAVVKLQMNTPVPNEILDQLFKVSGAHFADKGFVSTGGRILESSTALTMKQLTQMRQVKGVLSVEVNPKLIPMSESIGGSSVVSPNIMQWYMYGKYEHPIRGITYGANIFNQQDERLFAAEGEGITVAVLDSGYTAHPDFMSQLQPLDNYPGVYGYRFMQDATRPDALSDLNEEQPNIHGTQVIGVIAGQKAQGSGVLGVAPKAMIVPVKVLPNYNNDISVIDAMLWAVGMHPTIDNPNPAQVLNMSLGLGDPFEGDTQCGDVHPSLEQVALDVLEAKAVAVVASGNVPMPAYFNILTTCPGVITVSALGQSGSIANYSALDETVEITAPGGDGNNFYTTSYERGVANYKSVSGTSFAAPIISGIIADMLSINPHLTRDQIVTILQQTATPFDNDKQRCHFNGEQPIRCLETGRVNAAAAIQKVEEITLEAEKMESIK